MEGGGNIKEDDSNIQTGMISREAYDRAKAEDNLTVTQKPKATESGPVLDRSPFARPEGYQKPPTEVAPQTQPQETKPLSTLDRALGLFKRQNIPVPENPGPRYEKPKS